MMNQRLAAWVLACAACGAAIAQDAKKLEPEQVKKYGTLCAEGTAKLADPPLKVSPDIERGMGLTAENRGGLVLPDAKLTADALQKLDKDILPLGVLYTLRVTIIVVDKEVPADKLRTLEISAGDEKATVAVMWLAAAKVGGRLALLVYTDSNTPALVTTLADSDEKTESPIELEARGAGDNRATLILKIAGRYKASIPVAALE